MYTTNKRKNIIDPVHGFVRIKSDLIFDVMERPCVQRLRRIIQVGLTHLVYPGSVHSRFQHALGAMHLMGSALDVLKEKGAKISEHEYIQAQIAVLLHDLGHGPCSHALEKFLLDKVPHEYLSDRLMRSINEEMDGKISLAVDIFNNRYERPFFHQLVSGQLDVDRMDYLLRDSFHTGVYEGTVGLARIINMLDLVDEKIVV